jgi:hypothetical protein
MNPDSFMRGLQTGANDDGNSIARAIVENLAELVSVFETFLGVKGTAGSFTLAAASTLVVPQALVTASSFIFLQPTNAAAATLQGSNESLYISAKSAGVSFTVATAAGTAATGGEEFSYLLVNLT